jgi:hypothetical protein
MHPTMRLSTLTLLLLTPLALTFSSPTPHLLSTRQLANPSSAPYITSYAYITEWADASVLAPTDYELAPNGCEYTITFLRDASDVKYNLGVSVTYGGVDGWVFSSVLPTQLDSTQLHPIQSNSCPYLVKASERVWNTH